MLRCSTALAEQPDLLPSCLIATPDSPSSFTTVSPISLTHHPQTPTAHPRRLASPASLHPSISLCSSAAPSSPLRCSTTFSRPRQLSPDSINSSNSSSSSFLDSPLRLLLPHRFLHQQRLMSRLHWVNNAASSCNQKIKQSVYKCRFNGVSIYKVFKLLSEVNAVPAATASERRRHFLEKPPPCHRPAAIASIHSSVAAASSSSPASLSPPHPLLPPFYASRFCFCQSCPPLPVQAACSKK